MAEQTARDDHRPASTRCECNARTWDSSRSGYRASADATAAAVKLGTGGTS